MQEAVLRAVVRPRNNMMRLRRAEIAAPLPDSAGAWLCDKLHAADVSGCLLSGCVLLSRIVQLQELDPMATSLIRQIPNLISIARILSVPVLLVLALQGQSEPFKWLLLAALLSDILDGLIARTFGIASPLGATLDSIGDSLLMVAAAVGVWIFHPVFVQEHGMTVLIVLALWALEMLVSFWRYGKLSSFHAYSVRVGAYLLGIFVMVLFIWGFNSWLFYLAVMVNVLGYLEEFVLLWLLPEWSANVRGVYWVLRNRRDTA